MLAELHKCPTLFATTSDNVVVMVKMSADVQRLCIMSASQAGASHKQEYTEAEILPIREAANKRFTWERFFDELQTSFNVGKVGSKDGKAITCNLNVEGEKCEFQLAPSQDDCQKQIIDALFRYHYVHTHPKDIDKQLEEATKREAEVRATAVELEKEEASLNLIISRSKEQDAKNEQAYADLQAQLAAVEQEKRQSGELSVADEEDDDAGISRVRLPLVGKDCKDFDPELLKLVKSKFISEPDNSAPFNAIIRPYTSSELQQHTTTFPDEQRETLWSCMNNLDDWGYDVFKLQRTMSGDDHYSLATQTHGGSLFITMYALLFKYGLMQKFKMDERIVLNWLSVIEAGYHGNPYHNSMHAADVLHILHYILSKGGLIEKLNLKDDDVFAALFAAAIHDYDHPGVNNSFHTHAQSYLATLYNDRSVLENRHVSNTFELMKLPRFNILAGFSEDQRRDIRDTIIEMVLATDMGLHGKFVAQWKRRIQENHHFEKKDDVRLALSMMLKMADISNCGRPHDIYMTWGAKIADEFYMQGDRERNFGLPCSPFMDRMQPAMAKGQISFMNFVVVPMFESISEFLPEMHFSVDLTEANKSYWLERPDE
jgi:3',5'-cyclic-nucleotide phosphodiesterase